MNNKHSQVLIVFRKNLENETLRVNFRAEDLHCYYCSYFRMNLFFDEVLLMALTSTEQLFIEGPLYGRFLYNDHLPYFQ